jgi:hypothetical protein
LVGHGFDALVRLAEEGLVQGKSALTFVHLHFNAAAAPAVPRRFLIDERN